MIRDYATIDDLVLLWRDISADEARRASALITAVSAEIRATADRLGRDFDKMLDEDSNLVDVAKSVVCDVVRRYMNDVKADTPAMSQMSESAGGYSISGTFLVPGGGLYIKKSELARLGLRRQRIGVIDLC